MNELSNFSQEVAWLRWDKKRGKSPLFRPVIVKTGDDGWTDET